MQTVTANWRFAVRRMQLGHRTTHDDGRDMVVGRMSLLIRLLVLVGLAAWPAVGVLSYIQYNLQAEGRQRIATEAMRQAELLNADLSNLVEGARQLSVAIAQYPLVQAGDGGCAAPLNAMRRALPQYAVLSVVAVDGQVICSTDAAQQSVTEAGVARHLNDVAAAGEFEVGTFLPEVPGRPAVLPFCLPFTLQSGHPAIVMVGLSLDWMGAHLGQLKRDEDNMVVVADRNGITLGRFPEHDRYVGKLSPPALRPLIAGHVRGTQLIEGYDGTVRLIGFIPPSQTPVGMFVSIGLSLPEMLAPLDRELARGRVLMVIVAVLSMIGALLAGHRFIRQPTAALLQAAQRWSSGDLQARARLREASHSEFGSLATAFNDMAGALDVQRRELQALNATLEARVDERTRALADSRNRLQQEIFERERTETSLRQVQKLQAVGQLAGGIAHDFNNLLTAVIGGLDILRGRLRTGQEGLVKLVDNALSAAERGSRLTGQLLAFARRQQLLPVPTNMNTTVVALSALLASTLGRAIRIQTDLAHELWPAMAEPSQIEAAIINLAINARDAMPEGGVVTIATRNLTLAAENGLPEGDYVAVRVTDTGLGMTQEVAARAFEPFFTTKEVGRGSGLGLSQVHGLAAQLGGDVRIESAPGAGTTVTLLLPRTHLEPVALPEPPVAAREPGERRSRILVVDDDREVRFMTTEMLEERGYAVEQAGSGDEALEILEDDPAFDLLLVDLAMPGMNGADVIEAARALRPALRTLLMTGNSEFKDVTLPERVEVIRKPFNIASLDQRLRGLLSRPHLRLLTAGKED